MVIAVVIGQVTPPMAIALVITGRIADVDQLQVFRANMPFLWGMLAFLILIMAVPQIATWLPDLLRN
jgi:TRAP-type C4-dicarboxylate transport system permease large subunit